MIDEILCRFFTPLTVPRVLSSSSANDFTNDNYFAALALNRHMTIPPGH